MQMQFIIRKIHTTYSTLLVSVAQRSMH